MTQEERAEKRKEAEIAQEEKKEQEKGNLCNLNQWQRMITVNIYVHVTYATVFLLCNTSSATVRQGTCWWYELI